MVVENDLSGRPGGGGTDLERGYGDVRPWRLPFHASPAARKGPISSKRVSSQDPLLRKFGNFGLNSLNFHSSFSSQAPKFGNFQLTSPQIWKFSAHKRPNLEIFRSQAPLFRGKCQFASPTLRKPGPHTPTWKKVECPPPPPRAGRVHWYVGFLYSCSCYMLCMIDWNLDVLIWKIGLDLMWGNKKKEHCSTDDRTFQLGRSAGLFCFVFVLLFCFVLFCFSVVTLLSIYSYKCLVRIQITQVMKGKSANKMKYKEKEKQGEFAVLLYS